MDSPLFLDAGEAALVVEFGRSVDPAVHDRVMVLDAALAAAPPAGVQELVPTYRSLMIHYDPLVIRRAALVAAVEGALAQGGETPAAPRHWAVPCCYDLPHGEDLEEVARVLGLTRDQAIAQHLAGRYRLYMYGFAPGYAYLGGLAETLAISRRATPRPPHPAGAVMIGGGLCGIATFPMPTGWYVLGRTPERLYAPARTETFLLQPGDVLRFEPVDRATFADLEARAEAGETVARREATAA